MVSETRRWVSGGPLPTGPLGLVWASSLRALLLAWATLELPVRGHTPVTWVTATMGALFAGFAMVASYHWLWGARRTLDWTEKVVSMASALAWFYLTYAFLETGRHLVSDYGLLGIGLSAVLGFMALCLSALFLPFIRLGRTRVLRLD